MSNTFAQLMAGGGKVLGLQRHASRTQAAIARLEAVGFRNLVPERGVDGFEDDLSPWQGRIRETHEDSALYGRGEIGFTASCIRMLTTGEIPPYLLLFEDDCVPHPDIARLGEEYWAETPKDFDVLYMGWQNNHGQLPSRRIHRNIRAYCTHAWVVSAGGVAKIRELLAAGPCAKFDVQLLRWIQAGKLQSVAWDRNGLAVPFGDEIYRSRMDGLFYQLRSIGSTIHEAEPVIEQNSVNLDIGIVCYNQVEQVLTRWRRDVRPALRPEWRVRIRVFDNSPERSEKLAAEFGAGYEWQGGNNLGWSAGINHFLATSHAEFLLHMCGAHGKSFDSTWIADLISALWRNPKGVQAGCLTGSCSPTEAGATQFVGKGLRDLHIQGGVCLSRVATTPLIPMEWPDLYSDCVQGWLIQQQGGELVHVPSIAAVWREIVASPERYKYVHDESETRGNRAKLGKNGVPEC